MIVFLGGVLTIKTVWFSPASFWTEKEGKKKELMK